MKFNARIATAAHSVEAAALAGLAHVCLFIIARLLFLRMPGPNDPGVSEWFAEGGNQRSVITALNLVAIGSIAFLWFVAVIRRRVGQRENRFFGTVFLGSALLTVALWIVGGVMLATPAMEAYTFGTVQSPLTISGWQSAGLAAFTIVGVRFEAVFIISATTVGRLSGVFPKGFVVAGYVSGLVLLFAPLPSEVLLWVFSAWEVAVSLLMLIRYRQLSH